MSILYKVIYYYPLAWTLSYFLLGECLKGIFEWDSWLLVCWLSLILLELLGRRERERVIKEGTKEIEEEKILVRLK